MRRFSVAILLMLSATVPAQAELEVKDVKAVHGPLGPERKSLDVYPFDELFFRFTITGAKVNADGNIDASLQIRLADGTGKILLNREEALKGLLALGGNTYTGTTRIEFGAQVPAGEFSYQVTVTDNIAKESASFRRKITGKGAAFAVVTPRFYYDPEGKVPAPAGGLVGQNLFFRLRIIGFDRTLDKLDTEMTVQLLDENGKDLLPKPITGTIKNDDAEVVKKATTLNFNGNFALNRAGKFMLRVTIADKIGNKTAVFESPIHVAEP